MTSVRTAIPEDFAECRQFEYDHTPDDWLGQAIQNGWVYVAEVEDRLVGYARLELIWLHIPYLSLITVEKARRRQGIGSVMIEYIAQDLEAQGHSVLFSSSEAMASAAQDFHRHSGFQECGIIAGMNERGVGEIFFVRILGESRDGEPSPR